MQALRWQRDFFAKPGFRESLRPVVQRFQIEDLILQDSSGVVFLAQDLETGKPVAVRRFFPFGATGGGLEEDEQAAYISAIERLSTINHAALRSVVAGGCDPVDGMPFIATEWIEGDSLASLLQGGPLPAETAAGLISQALEVSELLSHVFGVQAVWIEVHPDTIIAAQGDSNRRFTFWISPFKWLGQSADHGTGLEAIIELTEAALGWQGRIVSDLAGQGIGGWLKWLRAYSGSASLQEARENLSAAIGVEPPPPASTIVARATQPLLPTRPKPRLARKSVVAVALAGLVIAAGAGLWLRLHSGSGEQPRPPVVPETAAARASRHAAELQAIAAEADARKSATLGAQQQAATETGAILWSSHDLLVQKGRGETTVEGTVHAIQSSQSGNTLYLQFSGNPTANDAKAGIERGTRSKEELQKSLEAFIGRKVRVTGNLVVRRSPPGTERPEVIAGELSAIQVVE